MIADIAECRFEHSVVVDIPSLYNPVDLSRMEALEGEELQGG